MSQQSGLVVRPEAARLYCRPDDPKRMELKRTNLKKILPGEQVWLLTCGRAPGYKEVLGQLTFKASVIIVKDEFDAYFKQHQFRITQLPINFVQRHGKEFLWGWQWSAFQPFTPVDGKTFLPNKKGTVTWVVFSMDDLVGPPPPRQPCQPQPQGPSRIPRELRVEPERALSLSGPTCPPCQLQEQEWKFQAMPPEPLTDREPKTKRPRPAVCEFCRQRFPPEIFPFEACFFCGDRPSWHHGRCCPQRPRRQ